MRASLSGLSPGESWQPLDVRTQLTKVNVETMATDNRGFINYYLDPSGTLGLE